MTVVTSVCLPSLKAIERTHRPSSWSKAFTGFIGPRPKPPM
jgi:hypothetical protein